MQIVAPPSFTIPCVPFQLDLQWMVMSCNPTRPERETCVELPVRPPPLSDSLRKCLRFTLAECALLPSKQTTLLPQPASVQLTITQSDVFILRSSSDWLDSVTPTMAYNWFSSLWRFWLVGVPQPPQPFFFTRSITEWKANASEWTPSQKSLWGC